MMSPATNPPATSPTKRLARFVFTTFLLTFTASRVLVILIMAKWVPDMFLHLGGTHVHHLNYGIFLLSAVGALLLFVPLDEAGIGVVFDPLNAFSSGNLNTDAGMLETCRGIQQLATMRQADTAVLILHHSLAGKAGMKKAVGQDAGATSRAVRLSPNGLGDSLTWPLPVTAVATW